MLWYQTFLEFQLLKVISFFFLSQFMSGMGWMVGRGTLLIDVSQRCKPIKIPFSCVATVSMYSDHVLARLVHRGRRTLESQTLAITYIS